MHFFFNETATTEIYTLSLHDALPISSFRLDTPGGKRVYVDPWFDNPKCPDSEKDPDRCEDRKSTRLNSSHPSISYAVFCLKKKNNSFESDPRDEAGQQGRAGLQRGAQ